jgi:formate dehydrogenase maturation protein FdhE
MCGPRCPYCGGRRIASTVLEAVTAKAAKLSCGACEREWTERLTPAMREQLWRQSAHPSLTSRALSRD